MRSKEQKVLAIGQNQGHEVHLSQGYFIISAMIMKWMLILIFSLNASVLYAQQVLNNPIWSIQADENNWFLNDNNTRGFTFNEATGNLIVVSRSGALNPVILDAATGDSIGVLNTDGISGGTFIGNMISSTPNGRIFMGNLTVNAVNTPFRIYSWLDESAVPKLIYSGDVNATASRFGDAFVSDYSDGSTYLYVSGPNNSGLAKFSYDEINDVIDGVEYFSFDAEVIGSVWGISPIAGEDSLWVNEFTNNLRKISTIDGTIGSVIDESVFPTRESAKVDYVESFGNKLLTVFPAGGQASQQFLSIFNPDTWDLLATTEAGVNTNGNVSGGALFDVNNQRMYVLKTNNLIASYDISDFLPEQFSSDLNLSLTIEPETITRGDVFWAEIAIPDTLPFNGLYGLSFNLDISLFGGIAEIDSTRSAEFGAIWGEPSSYISFQEIVNDQTIDISVSKNDQVPVSGSGALVRVPLIATQDGNVGLSLSNIVALDVDAENLDVTSGSLEFEIEKLYEITVALRQATNPARTFEPFYVDVYVPEETPVSDLYAISFVLGSDSEELTVHTEDIQFGDIWAGNELLTITEALDGGRVDVGISLRFNNPVSGSGRIASIPFTATTTELLTFDFLRIDAITSDNEPFVVHTSTAEVDLEDGTPFFPPALISPTDNLFGLDLNPQFAWSPSDNATIYEIRLSFNDFESYWNHFPNDTTLFAQDFVGDLPESAFFSWMVRAGIEDGEETIWSDWSEVWQFSTGPPFRSEERLFSASADNVLRWLTTTGDDTYGINYGSDVRSVVADSEGFPYIALGTEILALDWYGNENWRYSRHTNAVLRLAIDREAYIYSSSADNTIRKLSPVGEEIWVHNADAGPVLALEVGEYGQVFFGTNGGVIGKVDRDGNEVWRTAINGGGTPNAVYSVIYDDVNSVLYAGMNGGLIRKFTSGGQSIGQLEGHSATVLDLAVDLQGYLFSASSDRSLRKWNPQGEQVWEFSADGNPIRAVTVGRDGYSYIGSQDGTVRGIDFSGNQIWSTQAHSNLIYALSLLPIQRLSEPELLSPSEEATNVERIPDFVWQEVPQADSYTIQIAQDADFQELLLSVFGLASTSYSPTTSLPEGSTLYWRVRADESDQTPGYWSVPRTFTTEILEPQVTYVYSGSRDNTVRKIDSNGEEVWVFTGHTNRINAVAVDLNGNVFSASSDNTLRKIDPDGNQVWEYSGHGASVDAVATDINGFVYSGGGDNRVRKLDTDGAQVWEFAGHTSTVNAVAVDDMGYVYSASDDGTVRKIDPFGDEVWSASGPLNAVYAVAVDNDGNVIWGTGDGTVHVTDKDGNVVWVYDGHTGAVFSVAVDLDGHVYTASADGSARKLLIDVGDVWVYSPATPVYAIDLDVENYVYVGLVDNTVRKLENDNANEVWTFTGHTDYIIDLATTQPERLSPPEITSPSGDAAEVTLLPEFSWTARSGAVAYILEVAFDELFREIVFKTDPISDISYTPEQALRADTRFYARVRAVDEDGRRGILSDPLTFTTRPADPDAFRPIIRLDRDIIVQGEMVFAEVYLPADSSVTDVQFVEFNFGLQNPGIAINNLEIAPGDFWSNPSGVNIEVGLITDFEVIVTISTVGGEGVEGSGIVASIPFQAADAGSFELFLWDLDIRDSDGATVESDGFSLQFEVLADDDAIPPARPVLSSPENGATGVAFNESLTWQPSARADTYVVQLSDVPSFSQILGSENTSGTEVILSEVLTPAPSTTYYWRVYAFRMVDGGETVLQSAASEVFSFTTADPVVPPSPQILSPENGSVNRPLSIILIWSTVSEADRYEFELSPDSDFSNLVAMGSQQENEISVTLEPYTRYFWRVRSVAAGVPSEWRVADFETLIPPPPTFFPINNAVDISIAPLISWSNSVDGLVTDFQLSLVGTFTSTVVSTTLSDGSEEIKLQGLDPDSRYFWRVRHRDLSNGKTSQYSTRSFTTRQNPQTTESRNFTYQAPASTTLRPQDYRLIGFPGTGVPLSQLNLGTLGVEARLFRDNGVEYIEISGGTDFVLGPGRGYWVLSRNSISRSLNLNAVALTANDVFVLPLHPGWNIITNPYSQPVVWEQVRALNNMDWILYQYNGSFSPASQMEPTIGYYVFNNTGSSMQLQIPFAEIGLLNKDNELRSRITDFKTDDLVNRLQLEHALKNESTSSEDYEEPGAYVLSMAVELEESDEIRTHTVFVSESDHDRNIYHPDLHFADTGVVLLPQTEDSRAYRMAEFTGLFTGDDNGFTRSVHIENKSGYNLSLSCSTTGSLSLEACALIHSKTGRVFELKSDENQPEGESVSHRLPGGEYVWAAGSAEFIQQAAESLLPEEVELLSAWPNPFNPSATIAFRLPEELPVRLSVYDVLGRQVAVLVHQEELSAGYHQVTFDGTRLASGVYIYRLDAPGSTLTGKMTLIK